MKKFILLILVFVSSCKDNDGPKTKEIPPSQTKDTTQVSGIPDNHEIPVHTKPNIFKNHGGLILRPIGFKYINVKESKTYSNELNEEQKQLFKSKLLTDEEYFKTHKITFPNRYLEVRIGPRAVFSNDFIYYRISIGWSDKNKIGTRWMSYVIETKYINKEILLKNPADIVNLDYEKHILTFNLGKSIFKYQVNWDIKKPIEIKKKK